MLASLIFVICNIFVHKYKYLIETVRGYPQFYTLSPLLNGFQKEKYTPNT